MTKGEILIIGGAGFIGSHVNKRLNEAGYSTVVFDNLSRGNRSAVIKGTFIQGDLADRSAIKKILDEHNFDAVMHFAALTDVGESVANPLKYYRENVINTIHLLEELTVSRPCPLIFSSSAAVYGIPEYIPLNESHPCKPINPYGETKKTMEDLLIDCGQSSKKFTFCALRYFNAAGGDPDGQIKIIRQTENNLIPLVLKNLRNNTPKATLFGSNYDTPDGTCIRDYIHVMDLADAHLLAMEKLLNGSPSMIYNLGNGNGFSVLEVLNSIQKVTKIPLDITWGPRRAGDPPILLADASKARAALSWEPKYPALDVMVKHAWKALT
ncbi:MAG: UDP-glucose 4-epimerase GalE [Parachlamydiales bacterium]|jgi:UDP-glucose 4-epimerase